MNKKIGQLVSLLRIDFRVLIGISMGVFLFILFFQPFPIDGFDFNNRLLFVAGLGTIVFLFMVLVRIVYRWYIQRNQQYDLKSAPPAYIYSFIMVAVNSVAFAFYLHYLGSVELSFFIMFKVVLICLAPVALLRMYDILNGLKQENELLITDRKVLHARVEQYEEDYLSKTIDFVAENNTESFSLLIADIAFIRSADNYVEIVYKEGSGFKKKLLRITLKNVEQQIKQYSNFIRCHRICIVNSHYIERLNTNDNAHWLVIKGFEEQIPVSRQYLLKLKEIL